MRSSAWAIIAYQRGRELHGLHRQLSTLGTLTREAQQMEFRIQDAERR